MVGGGGGGPREHVAAASSSMMKLSRDDIAALEVIADSSTRFQHKLKTKNLSIKWILRRVRADGQSASTSANHTPTREGRSADDSGHDEHAGSEGGTPLPIADASGGDLVLGSAEQQQHRNGHSTQSNASHSARRSSGGRSSRASIRSRAVPMVFAPPPSVMLRLDTLDTSVAVEDSDEILINSPRSAFVILKNGLSVEEICAVSRQAYFNRGLLDGVTVETVQTRIAAENERRQQKVAVLLKEYRALCKNVSSSELVDAIRSHRFGFEQEQERNAAELRTLPHYAHSGKLDVSVLDSDCIDVVIKSRNRTLNEIRRVLNQRDRVLQQSIEKERVLFEKEASQERESRRVQEQQQRAREEKSRDFREKREKVQERVELLIQSQDDMREQRREAMITERQVHEQRAAERKALDRHASLQMIDFREKRRRRAREAQEAMLEERREQIVAKQEFVSKIHDRQMQLRKEELARRSEEFNRLANERRRVIRQMAEHEMETKLARLQVVESEAEQRAREFAHVREARQRAKQEAAKARFLRGAMTRQNAEAIRRQRLAELEEAFEEKLEHIQHAQAEKRERLALNNEVSAQLRHEKTEEKLRSQSAMEFRYIGYMNSNEAKTTWMARESQKRKTLSGHVRQEREAMVRARDAVLRTLDDQEMMRRKREHYEHHSSLNSTMM